MNFRILILTLIISNASLTIAQDSLTAKYETVIRSELKNRNEAFLKSNLKEIYKYEYIAEKEASSYNEFKKESLRTLSAMKEDSIEIKKFEIGKLNKVIKCGTEIQCVIEQETFMSAGYKGFSFKTNMIAISEDGINWTFINAGKNKPEDVMRFYPNLCESVF